jgi:hypothetical protein
MSAVIVTGAGLVALAALAVDLGRVEDAGLGQSRNASDVHDLVLDPEPVLEAAQLGHADVDRGLSTLEPGWIVVPGARLLALRAAAGGLALAGGDATADARARLMAAFGRAKVVQLHGFSSGSSSTSTRKRT